MPVPADWQPTGDNSQQALIDGSCGELHVVIWRTPNAKGTLMMFHGNGESIASVNASVSEFHQLGYNLMAWDYPGYGKSTNCWSNQEMLLEDAETAYQWLASIEKPENIHMLGYSLGTGIALSVAANHQHNPVYLIAAYDSLSNVVKDKIAMLIPVNFLLRYPMQTQGWVAAIQQPIYLLHGSADTLIRPARAQALVREADGKAHLKLIEDAGHAGETLFICRSHWLKRLLP